MRGGIIEAGDLAASECEIDGGHFFQDRDRLRLPCRRDQRRHDRLAGLIAANADDAALAMRRLAGLAQPAFEIAVERHAEAQEILDARGTFAHDHVDDRFVAQARPGADRICGVLLETVALADCGGDAGLRPGARRAFAERTRRDDGDRHRRELQRGEEAGETAADDNDRRAARRGAIPCG